MKTQNTMFNKHHATTKRLCTSIFFSVLFECRHSCTFSRPWWHCWLSVSFSLTIIGCDSSHSDLFLSDCNRYFMCSAGKGKTLIREKKPDEREVIDRESSRYPSKEKKKNRGVLSVRRLSFVASDPTLRKEHRYRNFACTCKLLIEST